MIDAPGEDFCFVGRITPEKGILDAIEIARLTGRRLLVAAKVATSAIELDYESAVVTPALARADVSMLGELSDTERDRLVASSRAALVPSAGPEPFGLAVIEALACGTPVLARVRRHPGTGPRRDRRLHRRRCPAARLLRCPAGRVGPRRDPSSALARFSWRGWWTATRSSTDGSSLRARRRRSPISRPPRARSSGPAPSRRRSRRVPPPGHPGRPRSHAGRDPVGADRSRACPTSRGDGRSAR